MPNDRLTEADVMPQVKTQRRYDGVLHFYVNGRDAFPEAWMIRSLGRLHYFNPFTHTWRECRMKQGDIHAQ